MNDLLNLNEPPKMNEPLKSEAVGRPALPGNSEIKYGLIGFVIGYLTASFYLLSFTLGVGLTFAMVRTDMYSDLAVYYNMVLQLGRKCLRKNEAVNSSLPPP
jgi:hypothetical protein